jgi:SAM-dependent methyltransferase
VSGANPLYDDPELAAAYARVSAANVANAAYERPAIRALLGDVCGTAVLDAGCAAGEHSAWLAEHGARVVALDASETMVALARERVGDRARVVRTDLAAPLPFADGAFDTVLSSLTLHYLADWGAPLSEFARVLRPGGRLVFSTHHPYLTLDLVDDYHAVRLVDEAWSGFGAEPVRVRFYHRPLERIVNDVAAAGFALRGLHEPRPTAAADERDAALARRFRTRPGFLIVDAECAAR